jgi:hypothetical protein
VSIKLYFQKLIADGSVGHSLAPLCYVFTYFTNLHLIIERCEEPFLLLGLSVSYAYSNKHYLVYFEDLLLYVHNLGSCKYSGELKL